MNHLLMDGWKWRDRAPSWPSASRVELHAKCTLIEAFSLLATLMFLNLKMHLFLWKARFNLLILSYLPLYSVNLK